MLVDEELIEIVVVEERVAVQNQSEWDMGPVSQVELSSNIRI